MGVSLCLDRVHRGKHRKNPKLEFVVKIFFRCLRNFLTDGFWTDQELVMP